MNPFSTMRTPTGMWHTTAIGLITLVICIIAYRIKEYDALLVTPFLGMIWWAMHMWHIDNRKAHDERMKRIASTDDIQILTQRIDALERSLRAQNDQQH